MCDYNDERDATEPSAEEGRGRWGRERGDTHSGLVLSAGAASCHIGGGGGIKESQDEEMLNNSKELYTCGKKLRSSRGVAGRCSRSETTSSSSCYFAVMIHHLAAGSAPHVFLTKHLRANVTCEFATLSLVLTRRPILFLTCVAAVPGGLALRAHLEVLQTAHNLARLILAIHTPHHSLCAEPVKCVNYVIPPFRGLHSSMFWLNVSAFCCIGGACRGCSWGVCGQRKRFLQYRGCM